MPKFLYALILRCSIFRILNHAHLHLTKTDTNFNFIALIPKISD